jgi:phosphoglycerate dehydrogenase-like enzyme
VARGPIVDEVASRCAALGTEFGAGLDVFETSCYRSSAAEPPNFIIVTHALCWTR